MKTFQMLPTDSRYIDLTEEQVEWMYQNYLLDNPKTAMNGAYDPDYDSEESKHPKYVDPDFDEEWNDLGTAESEKIDTELIAEKPQKVSECQLPSTENSSIDVNDGTQWEEVD